MRVFIAACLVVLVSASAIPAQVHTGFEAREGRRNLAFGLAGLSDWSTQQPFIDQMRSARPWIGHLPGQWGGRDEAWLREGGYIDENGWVSRFPPNLTRLTTLILTDLPAEMTSVSGRYHAQWEGSAYLGFSGAARNVRYGRNSATFEFSPGSGAVFIEFRRGDLRNLTVVHERDMERFTAGEIFNPDWLARIGDAETLRFMNWMLTDNTEQAEWSDRPHLSEYTWARNGAPLEIMLALANQTGAEPWFTVPHRASDDYMRRFAQMVHDSLRPDLRVWVEFSNEVWNWSFGQADWAEQNARARWGGQEWAWVQFSALRATEMMRIWSEVFADQPERLVRVLGIFTMWLGLEQDILNAPLWLAENPQNRPPHEFFDVYAVAGYFSAELQNEDRQPMIQGWLTQSRARAEAEADEQGLTGTAHADHIATHRFDLAIELAAQELMDGSVSGRAENTVRHLLDHTLAYHARVAREHDLTMVMYEGGTHVVAAPAQHDDSELIAFYTALNHSEQMGALYRALIEGWGALTEAPFNHYFDVGMPTVWGSWGALRHLDDDNPRWRALMEMTAQ